MTSYEPNFWNTIATFCRELAPVSGALLDSIGQTAAAIDRAGHEARSLRAEVELDNPEDVPPKMKDPCTKGMIVRTHMAISQAADRRMGN